MTSTNASRSLQGIAAAAALAIVGAAAPAAAEPARAPGGGCSLWGAQLTCGPAKSRYDCRAAGSGDVAPAPGEEKVLACRASARDAGALARLAVVSADGKLLDVVGDRADTSATSVISSVKVENVVDDAPREVVVEYSFDPALKVDLGNGRKGAVLRKELSILRWSGGALAEVFRACTNERPQPVSYARAAKILHEKGNTIRVQAKQQEYSATEAKQWSSDVTYVWSPDDETYLASSCVDLASHEHRSIALDDPEGDVNAGMTCVAARPTTPTRPRPPAPAARPAPEPVATPAPAVTPPPVVTPGPVAASKATQAPAWAPPPPPPQPSTASKVSPTPAWAPPPPSTASKAAPAWAPAPPSTAGKAAPTWAPPPPSTASKAAPAWAPPPPSTAAKAAPVSASPTTQCLTRLQAEVRAGRLLQECYDRIAGEAPDESLQECNIGELTRETCDE